MELNFFEKNKVNFDNVSLKLYKDFFEDVLCKRVFVYSTDDKSKINLYFKPNNFMHIIGCQHLVNLTANKFNDAIEDGSMSFEHLQKSNSNKFNDYTDRFLNFSNIYHVLTNCDVIYFNKEIYNPKSNMQYKYILFEDVFNKKLHLGVDTFNKGRTYFCKSLLVTSVNNDKIIKNQMAIPINKIEVLNKEDRSIIEQKILIDGEYIVTYKNGLYNIQRKELNERLMNHELWLNSYGLCGSQLNLDNTNLRGERLLNLNLKNSSFKNSNLDECIIYADLRNANFIGASINNTTWIGSNLLNIKIEPQKLKIIEKQLNSNLDKHNYGLKHLRTQEKEIAATKE